MSRLLRSWKSLFYRRSLEQDLRDELDSHFRMDLSERMAAGDSLEEAVWRYRASAAPPAIHRRKHRVGCPGPPGNGHRPPSGHTIRMIPTAGGV